MPASAESQIARQGLTGMGPVVPLKSIGDDIYIWTYGLYTFGLLVQQTQSMYM